MNGRTLIRELVSWLGAGPGASSREAITCFGIPQSGRVITVPHPKKDLGIGLVRAIRKQAGL